MNSTVSASADVLVIDDEPDLRTLYELTLLREGYRVQTAGSVGEAREQLQNQTFDAVITDMRLPDGLGMELLHELYMNGSTICIVTHDPRYARHAHRQVYLFDGRVVSEPPRELVGAKSPGHAQEGAV